MSITEAWNIFRSNVAAFFGLMGNLENLKAKILAGIDMAGRQGNTDALSILRQHLTWTDQAISGWAPHDYNLQVNRAPIMEGVYSTPSIGLSALGAILLPILATIGIGAVVVYGMSYFRDFKIRSKEVDSVIASLSRLAPEQTGDILRDIARGGKGAMESVADWIKSVPLAITVPVAAVLALLILRKN